MAYSGATAATSLANPPRLMTQDICSPPVTTGLSTAPTANPGGQGGALWFYASTNLTTDLVPATTFFSDGWYLGMRPGDIVMGVQFTSIGSSITTFTGAIVTASTAGCGMSTGSLMTSTFG